VEKMKFIYRFLLLMTLAISAPASTLDEMRHLGSVSFCLNPDAMPYSQRDGSDTMPKNGFLYDISIELIKRMGMAPRVVWLNSLERLNKTDCDLVPSALVEDKELRAQNDRVKKAPDKSYNRLFTKPYSHASGFLVAKNKKFTDIDSLRSTHVAVPSGSYAQVLLNQKKVPIWVRFLTDEDIINAVRENEAGVGLVTSVGFEWFKFVNGDPGLVKLDIDIDDFEVDSDIGMMLRSSDVQALELVNEKLYQMLNDGFITKSMKSYGITLVKPKHTQ
jgi:polar amino acid transport system substrate-binding protein